MSHWAKSTNAYKRWTDAEDSELSFPAKGASGGPSPGDWPPAASGADGGPPEESGDRPPAAPGPDGGPPEESEHPSQPDPNRPKSLTVQDAVDTLGFGVFQVKLSMLTGLTWMADAMEMMLLSILGPQLLCEWRLSSFQVALLTSAVFIGMGLSSPIWGNVCDKYGRKKGLTLSMLWTFYYGLLSAFAPTYGWIVVLRSLVGVGIGGAPQAVTLYSEFLPKNWRAIFIMLIEVFWALGAVLEVVLAMLVMPWLGWRWLLGLSTLPFLLYLAFCYWLPESAHYDMLAGNPDAAMATLARLAADNGKPPPTETLTAGPQTERGRIRNLFSPAYLRTTLLLWAIWFAYAFAYYGIVLLTTALFQEGDTCDASNRVLAEPACSLECPHLTQDDYMGLFWTTLAEFPGLFFTLLVVDRLGRKKTMALCFVMFSLSTLPLFACIGRTALTIFIFIARAFITGGYQVAFVYTPEVYPTEVRALGIGTCATLAKLGALLTPFVSQMLISTSMRLVLATYCGCSLLAAVACMFLPIETTGLGLLESHSPPPAGLEMTNVTQHTDADKTHTHTMQDANTTALAPQVTERSPEGRNPPVHL